MTPRQLVTAAAIGLTFLAGLGAGSTAIAQGGRAATPPPDPTKPHKLEITQGTKARYRVSEQLLGVSFFSDAVGTTEGITGSITINPDASIAPGSKITVDLKTLNSDQSMRDGYVQRNTLESEKFPTMEVVPKKAVGLASPLPAGNQAQVGFQLVTDTTLHGVTKEVTWTVVAVMGPSAVGGTAKTTINFAQFNMTKPTLARLVSVKDEILLEIEFRATRAVVGGNQKP